MSKEILDFEKAFDAAIKKAEKEVKEVVSSSAQELFIRITDDTPVGDIETGRDFQGTDYRPGGLKGNWQASIGSPETSELSRKDPSGSAVKSEIKAMMSQYDLNKDIYFSNNASYAYEIEYLGKSREKAPKGMMRLNVMLFQQILKKNIKGLK